MGTCESAIRTEVMYREIDEIMMHIMNIENSHLLTANWDKVGAIREFLYTQFNLNSALIAPKSSIYISPGLRDCM